MTVQVRTAFIYFIEHKVFFVRKQNRRVVNNTHSSESLTSSMNDERAAILIMSVHNFSLRTVVFIDPALFIVLTFYDIEVLINEISVGEDGDT